jgi:hypothetical protein
MGVLTRLWVAMLTQNTADAGTDDRIVLIINEDGVDKLHHTFPDTSQEDQEKGQANLYEINVEDSNIRSENLTNSSIRLAIRGSDFWHPKHVMVWGQEANDRAVIPLALEFGIEDGISTDPSEGNLSFPLRRIGLLGTNATMRQLLVVLTTADEADAGTDSEIELELTFGGGRTWLQSVPKDTPQEDLERGQANFYLLSSFGFPGEPQPRRNNLDSVVLRIKGDDRWSPSSFFLFAFEHAFFEIDGEISGGPRPEFVMPLVHVPNWDLGPLSTDRNEGRASVVLPLAPIPSGSGSSGGRA